MAITRQLKELNVNPRMFAVTVGGDLLKFYEALGRNAEFVYGAAQWEPELVTLRAGGLIPIARQYPGAREFLESKLWPDGPVCPHCGVVGEAYKLTAKPGSKSPVRPGVYKCRDCRKQFTVRVGTIFEDSHIPLCKWLMAIHLMTSSKKGISALQMSREVGITIKSAWFMRSEERRVGKECRL